MIDFIDIAVFAGMVFLRVGVPLLILVGVGYLLKRLDRRWEAEARAVPGQGGRRAAGRAAGTPGASAERTRPPARQAARHPSAAAVRPAAARPRNSAPACMLRPALPPREPA